MRDSKLGKLKPQLAIHYEAACRDVYKVKYFVVEKKYHRFADAEAILREEGIFPKKYAYGVCEHLSNWVKNKGWRSLPPDVFCGGWAIGEYIRNNPVREFLGTPPEVVDKAALLYDELRVARYYIAKGGDISIRNAVTELESVLSDQWLDMFRTRMRGRLRSQALDILSEEYGIYASSYDDIIELGLPF